MTNDRKSSPPHRTPGREQKGYQPRPAQGDRLTPQGGHQPTGHNAPASPPSNPPNQGSGGKK